MKIIIADDHVLFRETLKLYLERNNPEAKITFSGDFDGVLEILKVDPEQDLVLLDLRMPGMAASEGFKTMQIQYPQIKVALMSGLAEDHDVQAAIADGIVGYFPKTMSSKGLMNGIKAVLNGEKFIPVDNKSHAVMPSYHHDVLPPQASEYVAAPGINLTLREKDVLGHLLHGISNKEIAQNLGIQEVTVKLHVRGICQKMNVNNRTQAALKARELGMERVSV